MSTQHPNVEAAPVKAAPADATLVPLEDLAPAIAAASVSRRAFLGFGLAIAGAVAGGAVMGSLYPVLAGEADNVEPIVPTYDPKAHEWTFIVDTSRCIGCGLCVAACKEENHVPEKAEYTRTWVERHVITEDGDLFIDSPEAGIDGFPTDSTAPGAAGRKVKDAYFQPRLCMQCSNSPCTAVCPVGATYKTEDGIILVDSRRCIGCGYCIVACPYGARYLVPAEERVPNDTPGVADKCTWCYHRITKGQKPACVEVCPVGCRQFGDAKDPNDPINEAVIQLDPKPFRPEYGTQPRVLYAGPVTKEA